MDDPVCTTVTCGRNRKPFWSIFERLGGRRELQTRRLQGDDHVGVRLHALDDDRAADGRGSARGGGGRRESRWPRGRPPRGSRPVARGGFGRAFPRWRTPRRSPSFSHSPSRPPGRAPLRSPAARAGRGWYDALEVLHDALQHSRRPWRSFWSVAATGAARAGSARGPSRDRAARRRRHRREGDAGPGPDARGLPGPGGRQASTADELRARPRRWDGPSRAHAASRPPRRLRTRMARQEGRS